MSLNVSRFSGRRILITGASGFLGTHLCRRLRSCTAELHAVSRQDRASDGTGPRWWRGDLTDTAAVREIVATVRPDLIFHLASQVDGSRDPGLMIPMLRNNLLGTLNLLAAAADCGCTRLVLAGSLEEPDAVSSGAVPCSPYAASKWAASGYTRMFHGLYGLPVVILRLFMVYGPRQIDARKLIPYVILSLLRGEAPKLSSGQRPVDWVFVEDVIDGMIAAAEAENVNGATLDIGSGTLVTIREVAERLACLVNPSITPLFGAIEDRPFETVRAADTVETEKMIGWTSRIALGEGLKMTVEWYKRKLNDAKFTSSLTNRQSSFTLSTPLYE